MTLIEPTGLKNTQAVIFDMDGVLFSSSGVHERAYKETLAKVGIDQFSYADVAGMRTDAALHKIFDKLGQSLPEELLVKLRNEKTERARKAMIRYGKIIPHSAELIEQLRQKYRLALASSASKHNVDLFLKKSHYGDAFEFCLDGSMVKEAKPSPEIYLLAMEKLKLAPKDCVIIEDAISGVEAGGAAGIQVIGVAGTESPDKLKEAGAMHVVENLRDLALFMKEHESTSL